MSNITTQRGEEVTQPDGTTMTIEHVGQLPMHPTLSDQAKKGHILRNLKSASLVALGPLCDDGCTVVLTEKDLAVIKDNQVVLRGWRNRRDNLWDIPIQTRPCNINNSIVPPSQSEKRIQH